MKWSLPVCLGATLGTGNSKKMLADKCWQTGAGHYQASHWYFLSSFPGITQLEARSDEGIAKGGSRLKMPAIRTAMAVFSCQHLIAI